MQVSPGATAVGLTKFLPGRREGGARQVLSVGRRARFARVVPADDVQASAAAGWTRSLGARRVFLLDDKSVEGDGLVELFRTVAPEVGLRIVGADRMDPRADEYRDLAAEIAKTRPDAIYFGGAETATRCGSGGTSTTPLPRGAADGIRTTCSCRRSTSDSGSAERRTYITSVAQDPSQLPPAGAASCATTAASSANGPDPLRRLRLRRHVAGARRARARRRPGRRARASGRRGCSTRRTSTASSGASRSTTTATRRWSGSPATACGTGGSCSRCRCAGEARRCGYAPAEALTAAGAVVSSTGAEREMPARRASSATACATASATRRSKTLGMM